MNNLTLTVRDVGRQTWPGGSVTGGFVDKGPRQILKDVLDPKRKGDDLWALWLLLLLVLSFFNPRAYLSPSSTLFTRKEAFCFLSVP